MPGKGRPFQKGQVTNPGGRPKVVAEVQELARQHTALAVRTLVEMTQSANDGAKVAAANSILDRAYGKPAQAHTGEGGKGPINLHGIIEIRVVDPPDEHS